MVTFFISIVLARLLGPEKYGTMATMLIFVSIGNVIVQNGFQTALIQKKEITDTDISSVFWAGLGISVVLYAAIFALAGLIAEFFEDIDIAPMLRVLSLMLFIGAITSVEIALIARNMNFRIQCLATIFADVVSGILGVLAAFNGAETWALILQQLLKNLFLAIFLFFGVGWLPRLVISADSLRTLLGYGWKVLVSGLIDTIYTNIYTPFISRLYDASMVGYYNRGNQFPQAVVNSMASTVQGVMLPAFSRTQDDKKAGAKMLRRVIKLTSFVMFPAMLGLAAVADPLIMLLLGKDWISAAPLMRLCCFAFSVWHIHVANLQAINANGRSDIYLKLEIIKKILGVLVLLFSIPLGIHGMLFMRVIFEFVSVLINAWPNEKIVGYGPLEQVMDIIPELLLSAIMYVLVMGIQILAWRFGLLSSPNSSSWGGTECLLLMAFQVLAGVIIYAAAALLFRMESLRYLVETLNLLGERAKHKRP